MIYLVWSRLTGINTLMIYLVLSTVTERERHQQYGQDRINVAPMLYVSRHCK